MRLSTIGLVLVVMMSMTLAGCTKNTGGTAGGNTVEMKDFKFQPDTLNVKVGTKVTWINRDSTFHTVTSVGSGPLQSGNIQAGQTYTYTFSEAGTYDYYCEPHSNGEPRTGMVGKVVVTA